MYLKMSKGIIPFYEKEINDCNKFTEQRDFISAMNSLERAHILAQYFPVAHTIVHWKMLVLGFKTKNSKEIIAQIVRILVAGIGSVTGRIPVGNLGSARIPIFQFMEIPDDLKKIIDQHLIKDKKHDQ